MVGFRNILAIGLMAWGVATLVGEPPELPAGLGAAPKLPSGLGGESLEPVVEEVDENGLFSEWSGFVEARGGYRVGNARGYSDESLLELRWQSGVEFELGDALLDISFDLLGDGEADSSKIDLESGDGLLDVRSLNVAFNPTADIDLKIGRQVATWGVGDLLFINDLFPKDWNSFFLGRDLEYLKAPQDSVRVSYFQNWADFDLIYSPKFESDRFIDGERLAYWNGMDGAINPTPGPISVVSPGGSFEGDELHVRVSHVAGRFELAAYGYWGYWKSPAGFDRTSGRSTFPGLNVFGTSARGPLGRGILTAELGAYESEDDQSGNDPDVRNSELRLLLGYEREIAKELTGSFQYYLERTRDFAAAGGAGDRDRDLVTLRLNKRLWQQTLTLNVFAFYSPSQKDGYTRLSAVWKASDEWRWDLGANLFSGVDDSFFGQFGGNENVYLSLRRNY